MSFLIGKKLKMTQIWKEKNVVPVTLIEAAENSVSTIRTIEKNGYQAIQLQSGKNKREFRFRGDSLLNLADSVTVAAFKEGDKVKISGLVKGRGFQGVVKRHGFGGGPKTHGQKNRWRAPGSIGSTAPQRVTPGRRMAGHMGTNRVSIKNLEVAAVDAKKNILMVKGAVPGYRGTILEIRKI